MKYMLGKNMAKKQVFNNNHHAYKSAKRLAFNIN